MSRIHEALKKAEQERGLAQGQEIPGAAETLAGVAAADRREAARSAGLHPEATALTLDLLVERCSKPGWQPDPTTQMILSSDHHVPGAEELRTLRSRLYQIRDARPLRTVLITSSLPAEGKTFLTANLAHIIVRQHERKVLIIDADLRRSQLHSFLGAPSAPGLTDYLSGQTDELSIIQRGPHDRLFLIPGGTSVKNPAELLANGRLPKLLSRLAPLFDWVLVDSPPAIPVADASLLAQMCDGVLLVVRATATPFDLAQKARDEFAAKGLVGVVLNRVEPRDSYTSYYYHGYYGTSGENGKRPK